MEGLSFFKNFITKLSGEGLFLISLTMMTIGLACSLIISLFNRNYTKRGRIWYCLLVGSLVAGQTAFTLICDFSLGYVFLTASVGILFSIPVFFISRKNKGVKQEERELVRFLDRQINRAPQNPFEEEVPSKVYDDLNCKRISTINAEPVQEKTIKPDVPDFTHVKSVVERLTYFPLTATDKKQVKELERTIVRAENGEDTPELKNKINDGLGALLKIMSKYGV